MGVSTGVGDRDTPGEASGWDVWVGLISPMSHIGPIGSRSPRCAPDDGMLIDRPVPS
jgi:hypothetical protein